MILLRFCCCCCPTCTLYVGEGLDERSRVLSGLFGFISSLLMAGWRRLVTRRSSHATLDGALLAPSLHTMATNTSHGPRNRFGWPRGPKFLSIASGGRVVLLCLRAMCNERPETLWWRHTPTPQGTGGVPYSGLTSPVQVARYPG